METFVEAFFELNSSRPIGFDVCAILTSEIVAWLDLHGITNMEDRKEYYDFIRTLDEEWLSELRKTKKTTKEMTDADTSSSD